jgi:hypothetical protein
VSVWVHAFPSLHAVPFAAVGFEHVPDVGSQAPATWHWSLAEHMTAFEPVQVPPTQAYVCRHLFEPVHEVPSATLGFEQPPVLGLHVPAA